VERLLKATALLVSLDLTGCWFHSTGDNNKGGVILPSFIVSIFSLTSIQNMSTDSSNLLTVA
jgi:hypothetical protein